MPFWKCYFHVIWATHQRQAVITPAMETVIVDIIRRKSAAMGCDILAVNGVADHIHAAVSIPPKLAAGEWIRSIKGLSSHEVNAMFPDLDSHFRWQSSYGVLTFGAKNLPFVVDYIQNQKIHHAQNDLQSYLERIDE